MAFIAKEDLKQIYSDSKEEAKIWKEDYPAYERLMNNDLLDGLDPNLPEVNDGSLAAALFKLPKRIIKNDLSGSVKTLTRDEAWMGELANLEWHNEIVPNANTQAPFIRKWKDAVRKAAGYGSVPLITLYIDKDGMRTTDFVVAAPQDVILETGKVSDYDSDIIFWEVYYSLLQLENMKEQAEEEQKVKNVLAQPNVWYLEEIQALLDNKDGKEERDSNDTPKAQNDNGQKPSGYHFCIAYQRGVNAPFYMYHPATDTTIHEWTNDDPTGDIPVHYLYCYQDFINPYGIGIAKLAGGTQNVLDYMRQADVLATQIGLRPPVSIEGDADEVDVESLVYAQDAIWFLGNAKAVRQELADGVYGQLPGRIEMYKNSLNQLIPMGDTSVSAGAGDPLASKTPAGVKLAAANLSIDDDDFKDNLYITYAAVAKSMINIKFANMEGRDLRKVSDDERQILINAGLNFPTNEEGEMSNQVEMVWDKTRAEFDFEVDPEQDKTKDDQAKIDGLSKTLELANSDPTIKEDLAEAGKKFNKGEAYADLFRLTTDNDKIITDISPDEEQADGIDPATGQPTAAAAPPDPNAMITDQKMKQSQEKHELDMQAKEQDMSRKQQAFDQKQALATAEDIAPASTPASPEMEANIKAVMKQFNVDEETALMALAAEHDGHPVEDIVAILHSRQPETV